MSEVWECCLDPYWMVWMLARAGHNDERGLRQFACQAVRLFLWDFVVDDRSRKAVEDAERFAAGKATREELGVAAGAADTGSDPQSRRLSLDAYRFVARLSLQKHPQGRLMPLSWHPRASGQGHIPQAGTQPGDYGAGLAASIDLASY